MSAPPEPIDDVQPVDRGPTTPPSVDEPSTRADSSTPIETTASRDGSPLSLSMCHEPSTGDGLTIWGEITDPKLEVDEGIIAFELPRPTAGPVKCATDATDGVVVTFAEGRGAEYVAVPETCSFTLDELGGSDGVVRGHAEAEYVDAKQRRHRFAVSFAAAACAR